MNLHSIIDIHTHTHTHTYIISECNLKNNIFLQNIILILYICILIFNVNEIKIKNFFNNLISKFFVRSLLIINRLIMINISSFYKLCFI